MPRRPIDGPGYIPTRRKLISFLYGKASRATEASRFVILPYFFLLFPDKNLPVFPELILSEKPQLERAGVSLEEAAAFSLKEERRMLKNDLQR